MLKKIVVIGPECTGKTTLCEQLAGHYNSLWCPEYAREYLLTHGMKYNYDDLTIIAKGQIRMENEYVQLAAGSRPSTTSSEQPATSNLPLFIDTDLYVMKVWCEYVFD